MEKLLEVIMAAKPVFDADTFLNAADLFGEGILDSLDILILVSELEAAYDIKISATDLSRKDFMTMKDIGELIKRHGGSV